jgi:uncharacterized membrane protein YbhN (UPF0104 family)
MYDDPHTPGAIDGPLVPYDMKVPPPERRRTRQWRLILKLLSPVLAFAVLAAAIGVLVHILQKVKLADVTAALGATSIIAVLGALALVSVSYMFLIGYDLMALHHLGKRLRFLPIAIGGFAAFAFANTLGFVLLTAGSVRYRVYRPSGVTAADVAVITIMSGLTFALSAMLVVGFCLLMAPQVASTIDGVPGWMHLVLGAAIMAVLGGYVGWVSSGRKSLTWSGYEISLPGPLSTVMQLAAGAGDLICASGALYLLLPADPGFGYPVFVGLFAAAIAIGLLSHIPGGLGVFESIMLLSVPNIPTNQMLASLLVFRVLYYLLPMVVAIGVYVWYEASRGPIAERFAQGARNLRIAFETVAQLMRPVLERLDQEFRKRPRSF